MSRSPKDFLGHIFMETSFILESTQGLEKQDFLADQILMRAIVRSLEIIGEATKNLPDSFRDSSPQIPWRLIAGMRDKLIHEYFGVDYDVVWDVIKHEIPSLHEQVEILLRG